MPPFAPHHGSSSSQLEEKQTSRTEAVHHEEISKKPTTRECYRGVTLHGRSEEQMQQKAGHVP